MAQVEGQKHNCCSEGKQMGSRSWSDLPVNVLNLISGRLRVIDQIRLRFVCRNWHLAKGPQYERNIPWLLDLWKVDLNNGGAMTRLNSFRIPYLNQTHITKKIVREGQEFFGAGIAASKYGWLLLQRCHEAFFYSPFTNKTIRLPNMDIGFNRATFSSIPTSPGCICCAVESSKSSDKIRISICTAGDRNWHTITVDGFGKAIEDVVYSNEIFYCVFSGGALGAFFIADSAWCVLTDVKPVRGIQFRSRSQLVESKGDLFLVCYSGNYHVFKFCWTALVWRKIRTLGNLALFLGCTSSAVVAAAGRSSAALADRIYYHGNCSSYFYSLQTNRIYPWVVRDARDRIWIEPPSF